MALRYKASAAVLAGLLTLACDRGEKAYTTKGGRVAPATPVPIHITVVADGFTSNNDHTALNDFVAGVLQKVNNNDPFGVAKPALIFDKPIILNAATSGTSVLGLIPTESQADCYFKFAEDGDKQTDDKQIFLDKLSKELSTPPKNELTILVMNVDLSKRVGACANGPNLIITSQQVNRFAIAHELGHSMTGLKEEGDGSGTFSSSTAYKKPNCSDSNANPGWKIFATASSTTPEQPKEGCDGYMRGLYRPTDTCRMRDPGTSFCCVCTEHMLRQLSDRMQFTLPRPQGQLCVVDAPAPAVQTSSLSGGTYVTADFSGTGPPSIVDIRGGIGDTRARLIAGEHFAAISSNRQVLAARSLPDHPGFARAYPPGANAVDRRVPAPLPTRVTIFVPAGTLLPFQAHLLTMGGRAGVELLDDDVRNELSAQLPP